MYKSEVEQYARYEVSGIVDGKEHQTIAICADEVVALWIAACLAQEDKDNDKYYVSPITNPGDFLPGGGTYTVFYKENGKLTHYTVS